MLKKIKTLCWIEDIKLIYPFQLQRIVRALNASCACSVLFFVVAIIILYLYWVAYCNLFGRLLSFVTHKLLHFVALSKVKWNIPLLSTILMRKSWNSYLAPISWALYCEEEPSPLILFLFTNALLLMNSIVFCAVFVALTSAFYASFSCCFRYNCKIHSGLQLRTGGSYFS